MNKKINSVSINPELESNYVPLISFKTQQQQSIAEQYILTKVDIFFKYIVKITIDVKKTQISSLKIITEKDFSDKDIIYFYNNLFLDIGKRNSQGKLDLPIKWGITFDKQCTPIQVSYLAAECPKDSKLYFKPFNYSFNSQYNFTYNYGTIDINKQPIFYYIYFDLQEILDAIKRDKIK